MTIKLISILFDCLALVFLLLDPGLVSIILAGIAAFVSMGTLYFQFKMNKKVDQVKENVDGKMTEMIKVVGDAKLAQGKLETKDELIEVLKHTDPFKNE